MAINIRFKGIIDSLVNIAADKFAGRIAWVTDISRMIMYYDATNYGIMARRDVLESFEAGIQDATVTAGQAMVAGASGRYQTQDATNFRTTIGAASEAQLSQYNMGTSLQILGDPFSARSNYDGRGGVRTATGEGPFGPLWYNMVDVRHRNTWDAPGDIWGGELVWGMTGAQTRLAFRSRGGDGTPGAWTEVSTTSHTHAVYTSKATFLIGDGSATVFTLTHSLATKDVRVTVRRNSAPYDMVEVSDELDGSDPDNKVKLTFYGEVPTTNEYRVVVMG